MTRIHRIQYAPPEVPRQRLSEHFDVAEFAQHARHGFEADPYPRKWVESRLRKLVALLEDIRALCGDRPVRITSGFRSEAYNRRVGGARRSQHVMGRASDIVVAGLGARRVHGRIVEAYRAGDLPALRGIGGYASFTHVDVRPGKRLAHWVR